MLIEFDALKDLAGKVAMVDGGFDPLHGGHIAYFREAAKLGVPVLCNAACDAYIQGKHHVLVPQDERLQILDELASITYVHLNQGTTASVLQQLKPRYYVKGSDWKDRLPQEELEVCRANQIEIKYLDTVCNSSTATLEKLVRHHQEDFSRHLAEFEKVVFNQEPVSASHYDQGYFMDAWRENHVAYDLETRRKIEGKNPRLIKETFEAGTVLDLGCGPGALLALLAEIGVQAQGVDFSPGCKELAPPQVRAQITVAPVTAVPFPDNHFDLVISREVFEHLTILELRKAIQEMCRLSRRFIYVTTRYHDKPAHFLDHTTQFELDPTHITLMTKPFVTALFVLEGFQSRPDLEKKMDWLNKGRVIVMEKVTPKG